MIIFGDGGKTENLHFHFEIIIFRLFKRHILRNNADYRIKQLHTENIIHRFDFLIDCDIFFL